MNLEIEIIDEENNLFMINLVIQEKTDDNSSLSADWWTDENDTRKQGW